jgi:predicted histidine transporter YuiF (NhaC family)
MLKKIKELLKSPHIQIALATGICIVVMAYFSKRVLPKPIGFLPTAIPPFFMVIYEAIREKYKDKKISKVKYWISAIFISTLIIIVLTWYKVI